MVLCVQTKEALRKKTLKKPLEQQKNLVMLQQRQENMGRPRMFIKARTA